MRARGLARAPLTERRRFVLERCEGRRVLHLGCVDRPNVEEKLANGTHLHAQIVRRASVAVGLDSDPEGVRLFEERGWPAICADVESVPELDWEFDVVVAGELIEHVSNPGRFLTSLAQRVGPGTDLIITTPNAYAARRFWRFLLSEEQVHPEHVAYYSPSTLQEILRRCGYTVTEVLPYPIGEEYTDVPWYDRALERIMTRVQPWTADGLIVVARTPGPGVSRNAGAGG